MDGKQVTKGEEGKEPGLSNKNKKPQTLQNNYIESSDSKGDPNKVNNEKNADNSKVCLIGQNETEKKDIISNLNQKPKKKKRKSKVSDGSKEKDKTKIIYEDLNEDKKDEITKDQKDLGKRGSTSTEREDLQCVKKKKKRVTFTQPVVKIYDVECYKEYNLLMSYPVEEEEQGKPEGIPKKKDTCPCFEKCIII